MANLVVVIVLIVDVTPKFKTSGGRIHARAESNIIPIRSLAQRKDRITGNDNRRSACKGSRGGFQIERLDESSPTSGGPNTLSPLFRLAEINRGSHKKAAHRNLLRNFKLDFAKAQDKEELRVLAKKRTR